MCGARKIHFSLSMLWKRSATVVITDNADIEKVKEENRLLRRKLKKQRNMRQEVERLTEEANNFRENISLALEFYLAATCC